MAVTPLVNGEVIEKVDIQGAYGDVRTVVNAVPQANVGRLSLGQQHVSTITAKNITVGDTPYDSGSIGSSVTVSSKTKFPETTGVSDWQVLASTVPGWRLDNGGFGYEMRPGKVLAWATVRVGDFAQNSDDGRQMVFFALTWRANGDAVDQVNMIDNKFCFIDPGESTTGTTRKVYEDSRLEYEESYTKYARISEHNIMLWTIIDKSAVSGSWTLERLEVKAVICRGASNSPANAIKVEIPCGTIGFIGLNDR